MQLDQRNWGKVVNKLKRNPQQLMDMIPSPKGSSTSVFASKHQISTQAYNDQSIASINEISSSKLDGNLENIANNFEFYQNRDRNQRIKYNQGIYTNSKQTYGKNGQLGRSTIASLSSKSLASASNAAITINQGYNQSSLESLNSINDMSTKNGDIFGNEIEGGIYGIASLGNEPKGNHRNQVTIPRTLSNSNLQKKRINDKNDPYGNVQVKRDFESHREIPFKQPQIGFSQSLSQLKSINSQMPTNNMTLNHSSSLDPKILKGIIARKSSNTVMRGNIMQQGTNPIETQKLLQQNDPNSSSSHQINVTKNSNFMAKRTGNQKVIHDMVKKANLQLSGTLNKNLNKSGNAFTMASRNQTDEMKRNMMQTPEDEVTKLENVQQLGSRYELQKQQAHGLVPLKDTHLRKSSVVEQPDGPGNFKSNLISERNQEEFKRKSIDESGIGQHQQIQFPKKQKRTKTRSKKRDFTPVESRILPKPTEPLNQTSLEQSSTILRQNYWQIKKKQRNSQDLREQIEQKVRQSSQNRSQKKVFVVEQKIQSEKGDKTKEQPEFAFADNVSIDKSLKIFSRKNSQNSVPPALAESQEFLNAKALARKSKKILAQSNQASTSQKTLKKPPQPNTVPSLGPVFGPNAASQLKMPKDLNNLDFSVQNLQNEAQQLFSNFELSNQQKMHRILKEKERIENERIEKIKNYSLASDLFDKFKDMRAEINAADQFKQKFFNQKGEDLKTEFQVIDWKQTAFYNRVILDKIKFNYEKNPNVLSEEQLEYTINLLRYCGEKDFSHLSKISPVFKKATATLEALMNELEIPFLYTRMVQQIKQVDLEQTLKILVRAKLLMPCRHKLIKIFKSIKDHENALSRLNKAVSGEEDQDEKKSEMVGSERSLTSTARNREFCDQRDKNIKSKIKELEQSTKLSTQLIENLLNERKIFGTRFIFDGMNYLDVVNQELEQIREIINIYNTKSIKIDQENALKLLNQLGQKEVIPEAGENEEDQDTPKSKISKV